MRVLLLNYEYPPYGGGAGVASEALARTLASRGVTVDVVTAGEEPSCESTAMWDGAASEEGVLNVHRVRCRRTSVHEAGMGDAASYLVAALPLVRRLLSTEQYDAAHFFFSLPTGAMIPFLDLGRRRSSSRSAARTSPGTTRTITSWSGRIAPCSRLLAGSGVVPIASFPCARVSAAWRGRSMPDLDYTVIPNGVDLHRFAPRHVTCRPAAGPASVVSRSRGWWSGRASTT